MVLWISFVDIILYIDAFKGFKFTFCLQKYSRDFKRVNLNSVGIKTMIHKEKCLLISPFQKDKKF